MKHRLRRLQSLLQHPPVEKLDSPEGSSSKEKGLDFLDLKQHVKSKLDEVDGLIPDEHHAALMKLFNRGLRNKDEDTLIRVSKMIGEEIKMLQMIDQNKAKGQPEDDSDLDIDLLKSLMGESTEAAKPVLAVVLDRWKLS